MHHGMPTMPVHTNPGFENQFYYPNDTRMFGFGGWGFRPWGWGFGFRPWGFGFGFPFFGFPFFGFPFFV